MAGKKQSQSEKNIQASKITGRFRFKDSGHPLQRKGSLQRRDCGCRAHVCICSGRTCDCSTKNLFLETQFNGRTYSRPETHSPRADCARFMPRFRYLRVPAACAGALSAPRQGGSSSEEPSERERETPRQRGTVNPRCSAAATARRSRRTKRSARRQYRQVAGCRTSCVAFPKAT